MEESGPTSGVAALKILQVGSVPSSAGVSTNLEPDQTVEQGRDPAYWAITGDPESLYSLI